MRRKTAKTPGQGAEHTPGDVFRSAFEASRAMMFLIDPETGEIISVNPAACEFYGYDARELAAMSSTQISMLTQEQMRSLLGRLLTGGGARYASKHRLRNGEVRDVELNAAPITLENGRHCLFFIGHDITPRIQAERSLAKNESLLRAILDSAGDGISFRDAEGYYRQANPAFCRMAGQNCENVLGRRGRDFFERRTASRDVAVDRRVFTDQKPVTYEMKHEGPEGVRYLSVHKAPVFGDDGECLGVVSVSRDLTDRRKAEDALRKSRGLLRAILQSAQDCILVTDEDGIIRELNQTFCDHAGHAREDLLDQPLSAAFDGENLRVQRSTSALAMTTREPVSFTQRMQPRDRELWISVIKTAVLDGDGNCLGVLSMGRDVTAQRAAELALRQSERRLAGLIRQVPVGVFETDAGGGLVFANERMRRKTGRSLAGLAGDKWLELVQPADREDFLNAWNTARGSKREVDRELRMTNATGETLWLSCRIRPMADVSGRFGGYLGVLSDIGERKKAEALRMDVESVVRHDLKSPLGSVQNAMELLDMLGDLTPEQRQVTNEVRGVVRRMQGLISLSLDLHAMEVGGFVPQLAPVDLCAVVEGLRPELRVYVEGKNLRLSVRSDRPGPFWTLGERRLLDAVFSNLLKNAAEASPEGGEIGVTLSREGQTAVAMLRNQGEVPPAVRQRFFEKYATWGKAHGTGLGTYSARLMVRTLGGSLTLDAGEPGHTSLQLRLPAASAPEPAQPPAAN